MPHAKTPEFEAFLVKQLDWATQHGKYPREEDIHHDVGKIISDGKKQRRTDEQEKISIECAQIVEVDERLRRG